MKKKTPSPPPLPRVFRLAQKESEKSDQKFKLGAVIVKGSRVLSKGYNQQKTHPIYGSGAYNNLHAEGDAIYKALRAGIDIVGSIMYVYRRNSNMAAPCKGCEALLRRYGINSVVYTDRQQTYGKKSIR